MFLIFVEFCIKGDFEEKTRKIQILKNKGTFIYKNFLFNCLRYFFSSFFVIFLSITVELQRISGKILYFSHFLLCFGKILYFLLYFCVFLSVSRETYANIKYDVPNPITPNNADKYTVKAFNFKTVENTSVHK